jgi:predicted permease
MLAELRHAVRRLRRAPTFALAAVLTLALGLGAATTLFTAVRGVLLRPLPFPDPGQLVRVAEVNASGGQINVADPNFADLQRDARGIRAMAEFQSGRVTVLGGAEAVRAPWAVVSRDFFAVMGVRPVLGREFVAEERQPGGAPAVVVSDAFWRRTLGAAPDLGRLTLTLDGTTHQVVGVMPPGFDFPDRAELWTPRELDAPLPSRTAHNWRVVARLRDGVSFAAAQQEVSRIARGLRAQYGSDVSLVDAALVPLHDELVGSARPALWLMFGGALVLLLVAAANVGTLLLVRTEARRRELGVRAAVGASRQRLVAQVLAEVAVLAAAGAACGVAAAWAGARALGALAPDAPLAFALPRTEAVRVDAAVLAFALGAALLVTLIIGVVAGWRAASAGTRGLLGAERAGTAGRAAVRARAGLVTAQVALTATLLVAAGLLARSFARITAVDLGFRTEGAIVVTVPTPGADDSATAVRRVLADAAIVERLRAIPGVRVAGAANSLPVWGNGSSGTFLVQRTPDEVRDFDTMVALMKDPSRTGQATYRKISDGYVEAMGMRVLRGRTFQPSDVTTAAPVAVISAAVARSRFAGEDPIGRLIQFGNMDGDLRPLTVVGVVSDVREAGFEAEPDATIYALTRQRPPSGAFSAVLVPDAAPGAAAAVARAARGTVRAIDPTLPVRVQPIEALFARSVATRRYGLAVAAAFGAAALALAATGLYGVVAYLAVQRRREFGVRIALGARTGHVRRLVLERGLAPALLGVGVGLAVALAGGRVLASQLYAVRPADPLTYAGVAAVLVAVAAAASWGPARRASRVEPLEALREE